MTAAAMDDILDQGQRGDWGESAMCAKKGEVARVVIHDPHRDETDQAILDAVMKWKFQPGRRKGKAVSVSMSYLLFLPRP